MSTAESIRLCAHCRGEIPDGKTAAAKYCSDACRVKYNNNREGRNKYALQWKKNNPEKVRESRARGTAKRKRLGIKRVDNRTYEERKDYLQRNRFENGLWEKNARQAWEYWLKVKAPDWWLDRYYKKTAKPWLDHRLSLAERQRLHYKLDDAYRQRQIHKAGHARDKKKQRNDETHDYHLLLKERKTCPYCDVKLNKDNRVIDHMDPVMKNGSHSMANMIVCCIPCNQKKRDKDFLEWIASLKPVFKTRALSVYTRKHGRPPSQNGFDLVFE